MLHRARRRRRRQDKQKLKRKRHQNHQAASGHHQEQQVAGKSAAAADKVLRPINVRYLIALQLYQRRRQWLPSSRVLPPPAPALPDWLVSLRQRGDDQDDHREGSSFHSFRQQRAGVMMVRWLRDDYYCYYYYYYDDDQDAKELKCGHIKSSESDCDTANRLA